MPLHITYHKWTWIIIIIILKVKITFYHKFFPRIAIEILPIRSGDCIEISEFHTMSVRLKSLISKKNALICAELEIFRNFRAQNSKFSSKKCKQCAAPYLFCFLRSLGFQSVLKPKFWDGFETGLKSLKPVLLQYYKMVKKG